jgi:hypothetical protein
MTVDIIGKSRIEHSKVPARQVCRSCTSRVSENTLLRRIVVRLREKLITPWSKRK